MRSSLVTAVESGFHMYQHFGNLGILGEKGVLDIVGNAMALGDRNVSLHQHVEIDIIAEAHLANQALLQPRHAGYRLCDLPHLPFHTRPRRGIEKLPDRRSHLPNAIKEDDRRGTERRPVIGGRVVGQETNGDPNKGQTGRDRITQVVPSICFHGGTLNLRPYRSDVPGQQPLDQDNGE
jgi:hypothetical protein